MKIIRYLILCFCIFIILSVINCTEKNNDFAISDDGVKIKYNVHGNGKSNIVLIHGWPNTKEVWDSQVNYLEDRYKVITLDLAGFGESGNNRIDWTINSFANDVNSVIEKLSLKNIILVGFSMGGPVVIEASNKNPEQVHGVIIVDVLQNIKRQRSKKWIDNYINRNKEYFSSKEKLAKAFPPDTDSTIIVRYINMTYDVPKIGWWESIENLFNWLNTKCIESVKKLQVPIIAINSDRQPTNVETFKKYSPLFK